MESIKKYIEKISQYYKIEAIILFGSYAKGTENEDSDIDIAIISSDFNDIIEDGAKLIGLTWKIDTRIEPHPITTEDYQKVSNPFVREVVDTGIKVAQHFTSNKRYETCKDIENKPIYLKVLKNELHDTYWENINVEDLIYGSYAGQMLDSLLPMGEMNVRVKFNEELENLKEYIVEKVKARQTGHPSVGEGR